MTIDSLTNGCIIIVLGAHRMTNKYGNITKPQALRH